MDVLIAQLVAKGYSMAPKVTDEKIRFWRLVDKSGKCWLWTSSRQGRGYGFFSPGTLEERKIKSGTMAHRKAWELTNGTIPYGKLVLHKCDNKLCVRPSHLFIGTYHDNMMDMVKKKRNNFGEKQPHHPEVDKHHNLPMEMLRVRTKRRFSRSLK